MGVPNDEHDRTLAFAEIALGQIRALQQPALPRNFEFWYQYATGYNQDFNDSINDTLAQKGTISEKDVEHLYSTYITPGHIGGQIETVGSRVLDEIKQVLDMIDAASGSTTKYSESLADASEKLAGADDRETLRTVIDRLIESAKAMELSNNKLEARLTASKQEIQQLHQNLEIVRNESLTDPLTNLSNRKFFDAALGKAVAEAKETNQPLSLLMSDIDQFKSFNDKYGHPTGDQVLRLVAMSVRQNVKGQDLAARYGGEEFVIALPNTALQSSLAVADQIRRSVMTKELMRRSSGERLGRVTISIGVAALRPNDSAQTLLERADNCLYAAKRYGRNRVICEADPEAGIEANIVAASRARVA